MAGTSPAMTRKKPTVLTEPAYRSAHAGYEFCNLQILQHRRGGLQLGMPIGAAFERKLVAAPLLHVPIFVDMRGRPGLVGRDASLRQRQRKQRRAGERRHRMHRAEL